MREIKFRAYRKDGFDANKGKMQYGVERATVGNGDTDCEEFYSYLDGYADELMQYTGLHDAEGNEIWEGDVLRNQNNREWLCEFKHGAFFFIPKMKNGELAKFMVDDIFTIMDNNSHAVVVGNKFEGVGE